MKSMDGGMASKVETVMTSQINKQTTGGVGREQQLHSCGNCGGEHQPRQGPVFGKECQLRRMRNHFMRAENRSPETESEEGEPGPMVGRWGHRGTLCGIG